MIITRNECFLFAPIICTCVCLCLWDVFFKFKNRWFSQLKDQFICYNLKNKKHEFRILICLFFSWNIWLIIQFLNGRTIWFSEILWKWQNTTTIQIHVRIVNKSENIICYLNGNRSNPPKHLHIHREGGIDTNASIYTYT